MANDPAESVIDRKSAEDNARRREAAQTPSLVAVLIKADITPSQLRTAHHNTPAQPRRNEQIRRQRHERAASRPHTVTSASTWYPYTSPYHVVPESYVEQPVDCPVDAEPRTEHQVNDNQNDIDINILQLSSGARADESLESTIISARSPKRPRVGEKHSGLDLDQNSDDNEIQRSPRKRQRRPHRNSRDETHNAAIYVLQERRASKDCHKRAKGVVESTTEIPKALIKERLLRRLPVDELVLVPERLGASDSEAGDDEQPELLDDEISQVSGPAQWRTRGRILKTGTKVKVKIHPRGHDFSVSQFRFPKLPNHSPGSAQRFQQKTFHADGFEGKEADPTGRTMPIRHSNRRQEMFLKIIPRMNKLTLVSERPTDGQSPKMGRQRKRDQPKIARKKQEINGRSDFQRSKVRSEPNNATSDNVVNDEKDTLQPQTLDTTPKIDNNSNPPLLTLTTVSSLLKQKSQSDQRVSFIDVIDQLQLRKETPVPTRASGLHIPQQTEKKDSGRLSFEAEEVEEHETPTSRRVMVATKSKTIYITDSESDEDHSEEEETGENSDITQPEIPLLIEEESGEEGDIEEDDLESQTEISILQHDVEDEDDARDVRTFTNVHTRIHDADKKQEQRRPAIVEESWRPRKPRASKVDMEVEEDILNSPYPQHSRGERQPISNSTLAKQRSRTGSQALTLITSRQSSPSAEPYVSCQNSQGSIELGDSQKFFWRTVPSDIPIIQVAATA